MIYVAGFIGLGFVAAAIYLGVSGHVGAGVVAFFVGCGILEWVREQWPEGD